MILQRLQGFNHSNIQVYYLATKELDLTDASFRKEYVGPFRASLFIELINRLVESKTYDKIVPLYNNFKPHIHAFKKEESNIFIPLLRFATIIKDDGLFTTLLDDINSTNSRITPRIEYMIWKFLRTIDMPNAAAFFENVIKSVQLTPNIKSKMFCSLIKILQKSGLQSEIENWYRKFFVITNPKLFTPGKNDNGVSRYHTIKLYFLILRGISSSCNCGKFAAEIWTNILNIHGSYKGFSKHIICADFPKVLNLVAKTSDANFIHCFCKETVHKLFPENCIMDSDAKQSKLLYYRIIHDVLTENGLHAFAEEFRLDNDTDLDLELFEPFVELDDPGADEFLEITDIAFDVAEVDKLMEAYEVVEYDQDKVYNI